MEFENNISKLQIGKFLLSQLYGTKSICLSKSWPLKKWRTLVVAAVKSLLLFVNTVGPCNLIIRRDRHGVHIKTQNLVLIYV